MIPLATPENRPYPVRVSARQNGPPSRLLWLVKWLLLVPHALVLIPLWIGCALLTVVALAAIVITGRYPRWIFDYNLGVLRWSWRVTYYGYGVLGTDRYPPFTLADVPDYPARLDIDYPTRLHRGLALVKWLLAIPHLMILAILFGGGGWLTWQAGSDAWAWGGGGLVGLLVLISAITLAATSLASRATAPFPSAAVLPSRVRKGRGREGDGHQGRYRGRKLRNLCHLRSERKVGCFDEMDSRSLRLLVTPLRGLRNLNRFRK